MTFFCYSSADNSRHTRRVPLTIERGLDLIVIHILYENHHDWRRNESSRVLTMWNIDMFVIQGQMNLDIMIGDHSKSKMTEILRSNTFCKYIHDWRRNESARVVTRSNIAIFVIQGQIILEILIGFCPLKIELDSDFKVKHILYKNHHD